MVWGAYEAISYALSEEGTTIEDILGEAQGGDGNFDLTKPGGFDQANEDFDRVTGTIIKDNGDGIRIKTLPDGRMLVVRPTSSDGSPTLEVQKIKVSKTSKNKPERKIRYK